MGFHFKIGEAKIEGFDAKTQAWEIDVETVRLDNAPADGSPTDYTNERWPSYGGWDEFVKATGLQEFFGRNENTLLPSHPGTALITEYHGRGIEQALHEYKKNPDRLPCHLGRLEWLEFWITWALKKCEYPIFVNS